MQLRSFSAASAAVFLVASSASAQTVLNTDLPDLTGNFGSGVATTTTTGNGTVTTVVGPGGGANRATAPIVAGSWLQSNVGGGGSVGITRDYSNDGNGAAYLAGTSGNSKADLQIFWATPVALSSLSSVSFDFYVDPSSTTINFAPVLRFDMLKNGSWAGSLVYEFFYQSNSAPTKGVWTTQAGDLTSGKWWATNAALGPAFATAGGIQSLSDWIADNAGADLQVYGVNFGIGSGWNGTFAGAVDNVRFDFGTVSGAYDFAVVPEPAAWALMISGFGLVGGAVRRRRRTIAFA